MHTAFKVMQQNGSKIDYLVVANEYASTNPITTWHQSHLVRNPDDTMELEEDIHKLVEWANKWQMNFNVDKYSVMSSVMSGNHQHRRPQGA